jgi:hypothetical protein
MISRRLIFKLNLVFTLVLGVGACSWSTFSDLEEKAPVLRIEQQGEITSGSVGDGLIGIERPQDQEGGALFFSGNGDATLGTVILTAAGGATTSGADRAAVRDQLQNPARVNDVARAPSGMTLSGTTGPHALIATPGALFAIDINRFLAPTPLRPGVSWPTVVDFGLSVALANLTDGTGSPRDVVVGARDSVVLLRPDTGGSWPQLPSNGVPLVISSGTHWPTGEFRTLASGNLHKAGTPDLDEVVVAVPEKNTVLVLYDLQDCFQDTTKPCLNVLRLEPPAGALTFGSALLVADADKDGKLELLVGAPGAGKVYGFRIDDADFTPSQKALAPAFVLEVPGSRGFGSSLALGRFTGGEPLLAVGAPSSEVGGLADVGRIYLFDPAGIKTSTALGSEGITLVSPQASTLIGRRLASAPFRVGGTSHDLLAASGRDAVYLFFASLVPGHKDVRAR